jgi:hypothetical protein
MKVEELKNYGKGFVDTMSAPEMTKPVRKWIRRELRRELGLINLIKLMWRTRNKVKQMKTRDWSSLREHGLTDQKFLDMLIQNFTFMKVLADMVGMEKASEVLCRASDQMVYDAMSSISPSSEELNACGDAFESFKEYTKVSFPANERAGLLEIDVVEDTNNVFSYAVKYCALVTPTYAILYIVTATRYIIPDFAPKSGFSSSAPGHWPPAHRSATLHLSVLTVVAVNKVLWI